MKQLPHKGSAYNELVGGQDFIALDIETTGVRATDTTPGCLRLIAIALVCVRNGTRRNEFHWLVNPGVPVDAASSAYNGITTDDLNEAETVTQVLARLNRVLNTYPVAPIVCHNSGFDIGVLREEYERIDQTMPDRLVFDTMRIGARLEIDEIPRQPKLTALVEHYGIADNTVTGEGARLQKALKDARDTADVLLWLVAEAAESEVGTWTRFVTVAAPEAAQDVRASYPGRSTRSLVPSVPGDHYAAVHTHRLIYPTNEDEANDWADEVGACVKLRCAFIGEKVTLEAEHETELLPLTTALFATCDQPGMVGTLLGGLRPMLTMLDKATAREWWKANHSAINNAPRCTPESACPSCVDDHPCPQDVTYQLVTERAVEYGAVKLTSRQSRNDLFKPGHYRKMDTWPRAGMTDMAAYMMWLVIGEYTHQGNTNRAREVLAQCVTRGFHLIEPRLARAVAEYWAEQRRYDEVETMVAAVLETTTSDPAYLALDMWLHQSFRPSLAASQHGRKRERINQTELKRKPSPMELRPPDRSHAYRYRVYKSG